MKLLIADDHNLVRDALSALVMQREPDAEIHKAHSVDEGLNIIQAHPNIEVILLDLHMPGMERLAGIRRLRDAHPKAPILLMSGMASRLDVDAAFDMGINGYVPKTLSGKALVGALHIVMSGEHYMHSSMLATPHTNTHTPNSANLTAKEDEVLNQLFLGHGNKEIARQLDMSENTVKFHVRSLSQKLQARNRTDIIIRAMKAGMRKV